MSLFNSIKNYIQRKAKEIIVAKAARIIDRDFNDIKSNIIFEVKNHPVSLELINLTAPSQYIEGDVNPTLYGFLGFESGTDPVEDLISFLDKNIIVEDKKRFKFFGKKIVTNVRLPSKEDMNNETSLHPPWISVAWPVLVEEGTVTYGGIRSGMSFFLDGTNFPQSRSNLGIQIKGPIRKEILGISYISPIFKKYKSQFK